MQAYMRPPTPPTVAPLPISSEDRDAEIASADPDRDVSPGDHTIEDHLATQELSEE